MLPNIKTLYFINKVFSCLNFGLEMKIVRYNKKYQKILNLNLLDYRVYSGKYIIDTEIKGKKKEYNGFNDILIYEGEYLNGKRNGKGIEYYENGIMKFEGEYLNGNRWNGKGYDHDNNVIYELKDGKGNVKLFDDEDGKLIFEGEYLNGEFNGKGKSYENHSLFIFEGVYLNGKKWNGKLYDENNVIV